ncbi:hypothetical protein L204_105983 [Cryptococcus depauperatus]|nr:ribonuclease III [Cryptococcus depauperatus CBS 7855]
MGKPSDLASRIVIPDELPNIHLPPLPEIRDVDLRKQVFTHSSYLAVPKQHALFEREDIHLDNEKLEHVGDALLGCIVTCLLHNMYPTLNPGNATVMKSLLVCNETLSQLSKRYHMPDLLITNVNASHVLKTSTKTTANIFEAYIAGLFYSFLKHGDHSEGNNDGKPRTHGDGIMHLEAWLEPLFAPIAEWILGYMKKEQEELEAENIEKMDTEDAEMDALAVGASGKLNEYFAAKGAGVPTYEYDQAGADLWLCRVVAVDKTGREWHGTAIRSTKKKASTVAAYKIIMQLQALL